MAGVTKDEGTAVTLSFYPEFAAKTPTYEVFNEFVIEVNKTYHNIDVKNITEFYLRDVNPNESEAIR